MTSSPAKRRAAASVRAMLRSVVAGPRSISWILPRAAGWRCSAASVEDLAASGPSCGSEGEVEVASELPLLRRLASSESIYAILILLVAATKFMKKEAPLMTA